MKLGAGELVLKAGGPRSPMEELVERRATLRRCLRMQRWRQACTPSGPLCLAFPFSCNPKKEECTLRWRVMNGCRYAFLCYNCRLDAVCLQFERVKVGRLSLVCAVVLRLMRT